MESCEIGQRSVHVDDVPLSRHSNVQHTMPKKDKEKAFGKEVSRDLLARLRYKELIASGPRSPRPGAPHTFVTTETFLVTFDLQSLRDLPELELPSAREEVQTTR